MGKKDTKSIIQTPKLKKLITKEKNPKRQVRLQKKDQKRKTLEDKVKESETKKKPQNKKSSNGLQNFDEFKCSLDILEKQQLNNNDTKNKKRKKVDDILEQELMNFESVLKHPVFQQKQIGAIEEHVANSFK